jgi:hypothetical protein
MSGPAIFDAQGQAVGYLMDDRLVGLEGQGIAWLRHGSVFDYSGNHLAWWVGDHIRGHDGGVVAFMKGFRMPGAPRPPAPAIIAAAPPPEPEPEARRPETGQPPAQIEGTASWSATAVSAWSAAGAFLSTN